jgi:hypothetical protein
MEEPDPDAHAALLERRIDGAGSRRKVRRASGGRNLAGSAALLTAVGLGLQEVFQPRDEEEIVLEVEAGEPPGDRWVTYDHDPFSPARSRAMVRPWLASIP